MLYKNVILDMKLMILIQTIYKMIKFKFYKPIKLIFSSNIIINYKIYQLKNK
jgi:hypothetical protein